MKKLFCFLFFSLLSPTLMAQVPGTGVQSGFSIPAPVYDQMAKKYVHFGPAWFGANPPTAADLEKGRAALKNPNLGPGSIDKYSIVGTNNKCYTYGAHELNKAIAHWHPNRGYNPSKNWGDDPSCNHKNDQPFKKYYDAGPASAPKYRTTTAGDRRASQSRRPASTGKNPTLRLAKEENEQKCKKTTAQLKEDIKNERLGKFLKSFEKSIDAIVKRYKDKNKKSGCDSFKASCTDTVLGNLSSGYHQNLNNIESMYKSTAATFGSSAKFRRPASAEALSKKYKEELEKRGQ
jgi:hypothetical protein